jgi:hypothetical protein
MIFCNFPHRETRPLLSGREPGGGIVMLVRRCMQSFMLVVGAVLCLVFVVLLIRLQINGAASKHWPRVTGKVHKTVIETHITGESVRVEYSAHVEYLYVFKSVRHRGRRHLGRTSINRDEVEGYASEYVAGQQVDVFVNDKNPRESTLVPGLQYRNFIPLTFTAGMLVLFLSRLVALLNE